MYHSMPKWEGKSRVECWGEERIGSARAHPSANARQSPAVHTRQMPWESGSNSTKDDDRSGTDTGTSKTRQRKDSTASSRGTKQRFHANTEIADEPGRAAWRDTVHDTKYQPKGPADFKSQGVPALGGQRSIFADEPYQSNNAVDG